MHVVSWLVLALVMALFARLDRHAETGSGRGAGWEKFAYQAAFNINITRQKEEEGVDIWAGKARLAQVPECEMKLCKAGAAAADEDNGSNGTRTKIRSLCSQGCCSYCSLSPACVCAWKLFSIFVIWQMVTLPLWQKPRAPNRTLTICSALLGGRARISHLRAHSCSACLSATLSRTLSPSPLSSPVYVMRFCQQ